MSSLQRHLKARGQLSFRSAPNTLERSHQRSEHALSHVSEPPLLSVDHPRADTTNLHGVSLQPVEDDGEYPHIVSTTTGEACSSTDQPTSAYLSLHQYSDCVAVVPTPRTSSPIPDRLPNPSQLQAGVSVNVERVQGRDGKIDGDDGQEDKATGCQGTRGGTQLQKTVGRLKRYFGLAAACGTSAAESRQDDVSCTNKEAATCPPTQDDHEVIGPLADVNKLPGRRRTNSYNDSLETADSMRNDPHSNPPRNHRIHRPPEQYRASFHRQLKPKHRPDPAAARATGSRPGGGDEALMRRQSVHGVKISVENLSLATVVPGVRVRVPPRRRLSQHEHPLTDSVQIVRATTHDVSWPDYTHAQSRANVERWLSQNCQTDTGRPCSVLSARGRSIQSADHAQNALPSRQRAPETADVQPSRERSVSETDVGAAAAEAADHVTGARDQHHMTSYRVTPNRSSVPGTPSVAGSVGADGESHLGPSLVQLVAEIIEGLEQRSRDDSSVAWSGMRGAGTPASKILHHQLTTTGARNTESAAISRLPADDGLPEGSRPDEKAGATHQNRCRGDNTDEQSEKTLTGRGGNFEPEEAATECEKWTGMVPSCSVAVLRQRLLKAVEGSGGRRAVNVNDQRPLQRLRADNRHSQLTAAGSKTSAALVDCDTGTHALKHVRL